MIASNRTFGIEIELSAPSRGAVNALSSRLEKRVSGKNRYDIHDDGSLRGHVPRSLEIASPILRGKSGESEVYALCDDLKSLEFNPNYPECGFHVHLGGGDIAPKEKTMVLSCDEFDQYERSILDGTSGHNVKSIAFVPNSVISKLTGIQAKRYKRIRYVVAESSMRQLLPNGSNSQSLFGCRFYFARGDWSRLGGVKFIATDKELAGKTLNELPDKNGKYVVRIDSLKSHENAKNILLFYTVFDDIFTSMLPASRRDTNAYCLPLSQSYNVEDILSVKSIVDFERLWYKTDETGVRKRTHYDDSRYHAVNFHSLFNRFGTVEIRSHGSTISAKKILFWIALHQLVIDSVCDKRVDAGKILAANGMTNKRAKTDYMVKILDAPKHLREYIERCQLFFSNIK